MQWENWFNIPFNTNKSNDYIHIVPNEANWKVNFISIKYVNKKECEQNYDLVYVDDVFVFY